MAGHSKWSTIKRQKGKTDAARAKVFTKIGRELAVAVKFGGADPSANSRLRDAIAKAKAANMPSDNIFRGIKKAAGELHAIQYESIIYEGYGPGGVAVIVETLTDNKNRTASEMRYIFDRAGGAMGTTGCVSYLFESKGVLVIEKTAKIGEDAVMMDALDAGAEDFFSQDEAYEVLTAPENLSAVREALQAKGYTVLSSGIERIPQTHATPSDADKFNKMLDMFDDNDDVQEVYHNAEMQEN
ncbi:MAG: YebC/PmpR family DNA-binding transcriptional regulator [Firmicutes bacterium]|nr:YebC/PmpR family DNA-binding transcriptional regulator [Bacillota bacterium]